MSKFKCDVVGVLVKAPIVGDWKGCGLRVKTTEQGKTLILTYWAYGRVGETCAKYLKAGDRVNLECRGIPDAKGGLCLQVFEMHMLGNVRDHLAEVPASADGTATHEAPPVMSDAPHDEAPAAAPAAAARPAQEAPAAAARPAQEAPAAAARPTQEAPAAAPAAAARPAARPAQEAPAAARPAARPGKTAAAAAPTVPEEDPRQLRLIESKPAAAVEGPPGFAELKRKLETLNAADATGKRKLTPAVAAALGR